jgi:hypothetical protein
MDHYPVQCPNAFPNRDTGFGGCAKFPFLTAASESDRDLVFSHVCAGTVAAELFEPSGEQGGELYRVAGDIINLGR